MGFVGSAVVTFATEKFVCSLYLDQRKSVKVIHTYMAAAQGLRKNISIRQYVHHSNKYNRKQPHAA
jgi:hypothetical protein